MGLYYKINVAVDAIVFGYDRKEIFLLLIERKQPANKINWAIPGGFLEPEETPEEGAIRELKEETNISVDSLHQFHTFGEVNRDPRGRVISIAHLLVIDKTKNFPVAADDAKTAQWVSINQLPKLAFDHSKVVEFAVKFMQERIQLNDRSFISKELITKDMSDLFYCINHINLP